MPVRSCLLGLCILLGVCSNSAQPLATEEPDIAKNRQVQNRGADKDNWWDALPRPEWSAYTKVDLDDGWFDIYKIEDEIYAIHEPGQFQEVISFLIVGDDFALMFDTGLGIGDIRNVVDQLTDMDVVVLNSHTHYDHTGGNHLFETIYGTPLEYTRIRSLGSPPEAVAGFLQEGWAWRPCIHTSRTRASMTMQNQPNAWPAWQANSTLRSPRTMCRWWMRAT